MGMEEERYSISKPNRRRAQDTDRNREGKHPFKLVEHSPDKEFL